jgi:hypothetical protein
MTTWARIVLGSIANLSADWHDDDEGAKPPGLTVLVATSA